MYYKDTTEFTYTNILIAVVEETKTKSTGFIIIGLLLEQGVRGLANSSFQSQT